MENKFIWERMSQMVTEKYDEIHGINNNIDESEFNDMVNDLETLTTELEGMLLESSSEKIVLGFINNSTNQDPEYIYDGDSGFDLRANLTESIILNPLERYITPTGLHFNIPVGYEIQVRPRSGMAAKQGVGVLNSPGTVDQGYTGEVKVILVNLSNEKVTINHGDRIAQAVLCPVLTKRTASLVSVSKLESTDRGEGGFGSTGK
jgi:dUTP pyrophosphatase